MVETRVIVKANNRTGTIKGQVMTTRGSVIFTVVMDDNDKEETFYFNEVVAL